MNLVAIALLCQVSTGSPVLHSLSATRGEVESLQLTCQKYYVNCWDFKREYQLQHNLPYDGDRYLSECVMERKL